MRGMRVTVGMIVGLVASGHAFSFDEQAAIHDQIGCIRADVLALEGNREGGLRRDWYTSQA